MYNLDNSLRWSLDLPATPSSIRLSTDKVLLIAKVGTDVYVINIESGHVMKQMSVYIKHNRIQPLGLIYHVESKNYITPSSELVITTWDGVELNRIPWLIDGCTYTFLGNMVVYQSK